ncbi:hypothetical protein PVK06_004619 [Gossypium arboreum]|uniref:EF-hand domain-containing protein n=1 Tax=Gossypium arboreum TaxID=29729 RepID=A0ABR0QTJ4_GOSAR|nr:hypothetical protein PVK06_004619 [Gossypium arboreum]
MPIFIALTKIIETPQLDKVVADVFNKMYSDDGKMVKEDEFKKLLTGILWTIMLQLGDNPISVSSNCVLHEFLFAFAAMILIS